MDKKIEPKTQRSGLLSLFAIIVTLKIAASWVALNVFSKLTNVSDPFLYVSGVFQDDDFASRTSLIGNLAAFLGRNFGDIAPHYIFSVFSGVCLWIFLSQIPRRHRLVFLALTFFPSVAMWTALVTKESLASAALLLSLAAWTRILIGKINFWTFAFAVIGFLFYAILRPHFSIGMLYLFVGTWFFQPRQNNEGFRKGRAFNLSSLTSGSGILLITIFALVLSRHFFQGLNEVIDLSLQYFRTDAGGSGRIHWVTWHTREDFYNNLIWAVPFGVIGPLPTEAINGFGFLLSFLEGITIFIFPVFAMFTFGAKFKRKPNPELRYLYRLVFMVILPTTLYLYVIHAPLATPNPGSAIRYRAGFEYMLTIPILYVSLMIRRIHLEHGKTTMIGDRNANCR